MGQYGPLYSDGTPKITKEEWLNASPRLVLAIILGLVIATPLELKLFEKEINVEVGIMINEERNKLGEGETPLLNLIADKKNEIEQLKGEPDKEKEKSKTESTDPNGPIHQRIELLNNQIKDATQNINSEKKLWEHWHNEYEKVKDDPNQSKLAEKRRDERNRHYNIITENERKITSVKSQIFALENKKIVILEKGQEEASNIKYKNQPRIDALHAQIQNLESTLNGKKNDNDELSKQYSGLMARLEALSRLSDKYLIMSLARLLITLLFICIEIAPVLFKLMTEAGPYDDVIERIKHETYVSENLKISNLNDEVNTDLEISSSKNKDRLVAELKGNSELLNEIAIKQANLAKVAVEKWYQDELEKLKTNPDYNYTQTTLSSPSQP